MRSRVNIGSAAASMLLAAALGHNMLTKQKQREQQAAQADAQVTFPFFHSAACNTPKFEWLYKGGEDAWVISDNKRLIGVADGVGGWNKREICSGILSKHMMRRCGEIYSRDTSRDLKSIFYEAISDAIRATEGGSSTAVLAKLEVGDDDSTAKMPAMNMGDSAFMVCRPQADGTIEKTFRTKEQVHRFNCPFQGGHKCSFSRERCCVNLCLPKYSEKADLQEEHFDMTVMHNDIVVVATDGVTDNLYDHEMIDRCLKPMLSGPNGDIPRPQDVASCIATHAELTSYEQTKHVPFTDHAIECKKNAKKYLGGKPDDITCIVAQIKLH